MLDINYIRENLDKVKKAVKDKHAEVDIDLLLKSDDKRREFIQRADKLRQERNEAANNRDIEKGKRIKDELEKLESLLKHHEESFRNYMLLVPNIPFETVPEGDASNNKILKQEGTLPKFNFTPRDHVEIGEILDIIDIDRASKVSGSRFGYLKGAGVLLELALIQLAMETLLKEGFIPVIPPALIKKEITEGLGYWHGGGNENYYLVSDYEIGGPDKGKETPLYLIGTGEHAIVPMHSGEILEGNELPKKYAAFSPCFRREAGSYGKDTKGILRVHQFDKVEMVVFAKPDDDEVELKKMLAVSEGIVNSLGLPYQVVQLASGDLGFPSAKTIDIETWIPSQGQYKETHSISTTTDFQARRLNIKYKKVELPQVTILGHYPEKMMVPTVKNDFAHILNGTAVAIGRTIIAILENFQQEDGSVRIPEVLQKYTGFSEIKPK